MSGSLIKEARVVHFSSFDNSKTNPKKFSDFLFILDYTFKGIQKY